MISLAVKYRPRTFDEVIEQDAVKLILKDQIDTQTFKQAYLFCGPSGDGKTTMARIFANEINHGQGNPIEMDAASHNGVDDVREISQQAKTQSIDSDYKVYIIDECHSFSNNAWQAMLKLIEEPPTGVVFIFCTTNPEKIPRTILSRVQRFDFQRISHGGIVDRLYKIMELENHWESDIHRNIDEPLEYIAKLSDGGMRDAITMLDKCISYSNTLTVENVVKALGIANYDIMFSLFDSIYGNNTQLMLEQIDEVHSSGVELKHFMRSFTDFILDVCKYGLVNDFQIVKIPNIYKETIDKYGENQYGCAKRLLATLVRLNSEIKYDVSPKAMIEATLLLHIGDAE